MMDEKIDRIVELDIDDEQLDEELFEDTGVEIVSIVDNPAIQVDFLHFQEEKFVEPTAGETEQDFIGRCMSKLDTEFPDEEQRLAVCYSYWRGEEELELESYSDYPKAARENACRAIIFADEEGWGDCGTPVGKRRASQLCMGQNISRDTIARMAAFERHRQNKDTPYGEGCGKLMWDAWGGDEGIAWAQRKLEQIDKEKMCDGECDVHTLTEEEQKSVLEFCEDDNNGYYIGKDDLYIDMTLNKFAGIGDVITAIRSLDILKRLSIKKENPPETYWRYTGPSAQRDFCKAMLRLADRGKIFSNDEVEKMAGLNRDFGPRGNSSYSKLSWKGGPNCTHYWTKLEVFKGDTGNKVIIASNTPTNSREQNAMKSNNRTKPSPQGSTKNNGYLRKPKSWNFSIDEDKRIVMGPVMIPNKMILRRDENGEPFYIYFSKKTIRKMAEKFFKKNNHNNTDINHDENITNDNTIIESWISESIKHDKSYKYGFALPEGTWYVSYKINDDKTWELIKSGELRGFSLAGGFIQRMKPIDPEETLNNIKDILKSVK